MKKSLTRKGARTVLAVLAIVAIVLVIFLIATMGKGHAAEPPVAAPVAGCPNGYLLVANVWSLAAMPPAFRNAATTHIANAEKRDTQNATRQEAYKPDDISRTMGGRLRKEVAVRAPISTEIPVFFRDPKTLIVLQNAGVMYVSSGTGTLRLSEDPRQWVIETIWPENFVSPTISGGKRRLWLFPNEWGKWCTMNIHGVVP